MVPFFSGCLYNYADLSLVSLVPYEQLTDRVNRIYRSGLFMQFIFVVGFLLFLAYLLRKFTKPIKVLGDVALKVEAGDMQIRSNVRAGDEVGRLGRSFDHMLDRISEMIEQVKHQNRHESVQFAIQVAFTRKRPISNYGNDSYSF